MFSAGLCDIMKKTIMGAYVMEKQNYSFRSSLHGFNRVDVIDFLEKLSASHETELRERDEELRILREELADAKSAVELAQAEIDLLRLGEETAPDEEPAPQPEEPVRPDPRMELEAYRRAERYEREAKARAEKLCADACDAVRQAGVQMEDRQTRLYSVTDALDADFAALQAAVSEILGEMSNTRDRLSRMEQDLVEAD